MNDESEPKKQLGDLMGDYIGGIEATNLMLLGMLNKLSVRLNEAGLIDRTWAEATVDELANGIQAVKALVGNKEVQR